MAKMKIDEVIGLLKIDAESLEVAKLMCGPNGLTTRAALNVYQEEISQIIEWLQDYKRLLAKEDEKEACKILNRISLKERS